MTNVSLMTCVHREEDLIYQSLNNLFTLRSPSNSLQPIQPVKVLSYDIIILFILQYLMYLENVRMIHILQNTGLIDQGLTYTLVHHFHCSYLG